MSKITNTFLPTSLKEMKALGWDQADVILFSGDAYVDHPSFGTAVIARVLEADGYKVAVIPQPNWRDDLRDFKKLGAPRLFFGVSSGNMDSMVNHYTANLRLRSNDAYTPEGKAGFRPDYAVTVYSKILKRLYPDIPIIIGGIEASLRRLTHYDYWSNTLKPSILVDSEADLLIYGMGEKTILEVAHQLANGHKLEQLRSIRQLAFIDSNIEKYRKNERNVVLNSFEECCSDKKKFGANFKIIETESNKVNAVTIVEPFADKCIVVNPPLPLPTTEETDNWYKLPFTRLPHPRYKGKNIPAWEMIKFSVNIHRGCFGGCSFCTISAHQGKFIVSRSEESILDEIERIKQMPDFKGYLSDIGGPSANMYMMKGKNEDICKKCHRYSCIYPSICSNLDANHQHINHLYSKIRTVSGIKKAFVSSGVRYDLFIDRGGKDEVEYFENLCRYHVSGRLKVAPEHTSDKVLQRMRKPSFKLFKKLVNQFEAINEKFALKQQIIPYFISSHPGSTEKDMQELANETKKLNFKLEQVQDFTPTPMTLSSVIYYTEEDPYTGEKVYVAKTKKDKQKQLSYFFWYKDKNKTSGIPETKNKKRMH
ncbi:MAG: YgiQ family radical SAM protein [Bacteroidales bacterium]|nr:YgiQ family radical SAM protein [Bacteroidales bacterium]HPD96053.1 YgiQ family radical SAM protein [Tenuifilaceae bacterium]